MNMFCVCLSGVLLCKHLQKPKLATLQRAAELITSHTNRSQLEAALE